MSSMSQFRTEDLRQPLEMLIDGARQYKAAISEALGGDA